MEKETQKQSQTSEVFIDESLTNGESGSLTNGNKKRVYKLELPVKLNIIGRVIKAYRKIRNLSQDKLGELVGVKKSQISKIEKGDKNLTIGTIVKLFKALRAKITFKIELDNKKQLGLLEQIVSEDNKENKDKISGEFG